MERRRLSRDFKVEAVRLPLRLETGLHRNFDCGAVDQARIHTGCAWASPTVRWGPNHASAVAV